MSKMITDGFLSDDPPIVIDFGSHSTRAGFSTESTPSLNFRSLVGKKNDLGTMTKVIGDPNLTTSMSPFYADVPQNFPLVEGILDHIFSSLRCTGSSIQSSVLITEPVCCLTDSRKSMCQLMYECYGVPNLNFGTDSLFSFLYSARKNPRLNSSSSLILRSGFTKTHALVVSDGKFDPSHTMRLDLGGNNSTDFLQKVLNLSYPNLKVSYPLSNFLKEKYCYVATDYIQELKSWKTSLSSKIDENDMNIDRKVPVSHFIPKTSSQQKGKTGGTSNPTPESELIKLERQERMKQMQATKKQNKLQIMQEIKAYSEQILALKESDFEEYEATLIRDETTEQDLLKQLKEADTYFAKQNGEKMDVEKKVPDFSLIHVDNYLLTEDEKKEKKKQLFLHGQMEFRQRQQREKEEQRIKEEAEDKIIRDEIEQDPQAWYLKVTAQKQELELIIAKKKPSTNLSRRQSQQNSMARMKAFAEVDERDDADFGRNDNDWKTYLDWGKDKVKTLEEIQLASLDSLLEKYWHLIGANVQGSASTYEEAVDNQIQMSVSLIRTPEIIFQPSLIGNDQMGLAEILQTLLSRNSPEISRDLINNIYLSGGNMAYSGMKERLIRELTEISPLNSSISISTPEDFLLDPWKGAALFASESQFNSTIHSIEKYFECGVDYLIENNRFFSSNLSDHGI
jgi:actin-related protein 5